MYRGFKLDIDDSISKDYFKIGFNQYQANRSNVGRILSDFLKNDGTLNGSQMQKNWFPQINADIFISHSHKDETEAIALAGWLEHYFGLKSFVDSCIWGNSNDLLQMINTSYSLNPDGRTFSYDKLNYSASHVHMMLSTALSMMIDKTECLFFLNTPNSISTTGVVNQTESPWIYSEISMSQVLRKNNPGRLKPLKFNEGLGDNYNEPPLRIKHDVNLSHLTKLNFKLLVDWWNVNKTKRGVNSLDTLYGLHPIPPQLNLDFKK